MTEESGPFSLNNERSYNIQHQPRSRFWKECWVNVNGKTFSFPSTNDVFEWLNGEYLHGTSNRGKISCWVCFLHNLLHLNCGEKLIKGVRMLLSMRYLAQRLSWIITWILHGDRFSKKKVNKPNSCINLSDTVWKCSEDNLRSSKVIQHFSKAGQIRQRRNIHFTCF